MKKYILIFFITAGCYAQNFRETFTPERLACINTGTASYIYFDEVLPGNNAFYVKSAQCETIITKKDDASLPSATGKLFIRQKDVLYSFPLRQNYERLLPSGYFVPSPNSNLLVLKFESGQESSYILFEFAPNGQIYFFESESKTPVDENKIIQKYELAKLATLMPAAEKVPVRK